MVEVEVEVGGWDWRMDTTIIIIIKRSTGSFIIIIIIIIIIILIIIPFIQARMDYLSPNHSSYQLGYGGLPHLRSVATSTACRCRGTPKLCNNTRPNEYLEGELRKERSGRNLCCFNQAPFEKNKWRKKQTQSIGSMGRVYLPTFG